jgi:hypothetical protein
MCKLTIFNYYVDSGAIPQEIMGGVKSLGEFYLDTLMNEKSILYLKYMNFTNGIYRLGKLLYAKQPTNSCKLLEDTRYIV